MSAINKNYYLRNDFIILLLFQVSIIQIRELR